MCYGSSRFSEDLDFAGGIDFPQRTFKISKGVLWTILEGAMA
ncbi:hypothetical protein Q9L42_020890 (plasmid) [Methylomarinum sp. Ch1-1]|uniref:Uncharacterized protein n=1 Tax=Methylomarinum roseum TaxID=3067653 RepID=A0AAU7P1G9_9GAMM